MHRWLSSLSSSSAEEQPYLPRLQRLGSAAGSSWMRVPKCPGQEGSNELENCPLPHYVLYFPLPHRWDNAERDSGPDAALNKAVGEGLGFVFCRLNN